MSEWIKCSDKLPADGLMVIGSGQKPDQFGGGQWVEPVIYADYEFHPPILHEDSGEMIADFDATMQNTTHWMPLPQPPSA